MGRVVPLVVGILLVLVAVPSGAQFPPAQGDPVAIDAPAQAQRVSSNDPASFDVTVQHSGPSSGSPVDSFGAGTVRMTLSDLPPGWTASAEPSTFPLDPGASQVVTITVHVQPASDADEAQITITASYESPDPTDTFLPSGEASETVRVVRDEGLTRDLLEGIGTWIWVLLGVTLAAILVASFLVIDSRRRLVRLSCGVGEVHIRPGATAAIPFSVRQNGSSVDRITLHADVNQRGWSAALPGGELDLEPGQVEETAVAVTAAKKAAPGSRQVVRIMAVPESDPRRLSVLQVTVRVEA